MRLKARVIKVGALAIVLVASGAAFASGANGQATAQVRVAHMAPGAPNVDVLVDGQRAFANAPFGSATDYAPVPAGQRDVRVTPAGQNQNPVITAALPVEAGRAYTVVAVGQAPNLAALPLPDDNSAPPAGQAKVRVVHAAPDVQAVDVAVTGGPVLFPALAPRTASNYRAVDAGTYNLEVRPAGTTNAALRVPNVNIPAGAIITIFATGLAADNSLRAVPVTYPVSGGPAGMPRTGTGGLAADNGLGGGLMAGLAAAALLAAGTGVFAVSRRRAR